MDRSDPERGEACHAPVRPGGSQRSRRFVPAGRRLGGAALGHDGGGLAITTRGEAYSSADRKRPVPRHGEPGGVPFRYPG